MTQVRTLLDDVNAAYFDTRSLNGAFTEIHGDPPHMLGMFEHWKRQHENRDPNRPASIEIGEMALYRPATMLPAG